MKSINEKPSKTFISYNLTKETLTLHGFTEKYFKQSIEVKS